MFILSKQKEWELQGDVITGVRQGYNHREPFDFCFQSLIRVSQPSIKDNAGGKTNRYFTYTDFSD